MAMTAGDGRGSRLRTLGCLVGLVLIASACSGSDRRTDVTGAVEALGKHYREYHDYYSLTRLLPYLDLRRRRRAEIERLLGQPAYCPLPHLSYYPTDRTVAVACPEGSLPEEETCVTGDSRQVEPLHSFPVILVVSYAESGDQPSPNDRLDSISLGPVGE